MPRSEIWSFRTEAPIVKQARQFGMMLGVAEDVVEAYLAGLSDAVRFQEVGLLIEVDDEGMVEAAADTLMALQGLHPEPPYDSGHYPNMLLTYGEVETVLRERGATCLETAVIDTLSLDGEGSAG